ncbi:hypothetical protein GCM10009092_27510 [Bowmanella denitrificans]|uniref:Uncharacterized protein n=1 Tax=Bowmanella denitrificans TaxID=366582 RepID=A0ABN0XDV6_9ALTE
MAYLPGAGPILCWLQVQVASSNSEPDYAGALGAGRKRSKIPFSKAFSSVILAVQTPIKQNEQAGIKPAPFNPKARKPSWKVR